MKQGLSGYGRQAGYILAMNIGILALIFVGVSYMGQRMALATALAKAERERVDAEYALEDARVKIMLMLATVPRTRGGLGPETGAVALDGRFYRMGGSSVLVSFQDTRGLIALNGVMLTGAGRERIERLLESYRLDAQTIAKLTDALLDYRDTDDLRRLNGAEKEDYAADGTSRIRNGDLLSVSELARVFGWAKEKVLWVDDQITRHVSADRRAAFNPNTADWRALVAASRIDPEQAKSLVARRRAGDIADISGIVFAGGLGDPFGPNGLVNTFPAASVVVTLNIEGQTWGYRMMIVHTPDLDVSPWRIESFERVAMSGEGVDAKTIHTLPEIAQLRDLSKPLQVQSPF